MTGTGFIIPYLNQSASLAAMIEALIDKGNVHIVLAEDRAAKADDWAPLTLERIDSGKRMTLLRHSRPLGYTRNVNAAVMWALANTELANFWIVNDDISFVRGVPEIKKPPADAGLIGVLSDRAGYQSVAYSLDPAGDYLYPDIGPTSAAERFDQASRNPRFVPVPLVHGFCFRVSRACLEKVGALDEHGYGFGYGSDYDLSLRATDAGFTNYVYTGAFVAHLGSATAGRATRRIRAIRADHQLRATYGERYKRAKFVTRERLDKHLANFARLTRG